MRASLALILTAFCAIPANAGELSREEFTAEAAAAFSAAYPEKDFKIVGPLEIRATDDGDDEGQRVYLDNLFKGQSDDADERAQQIATFVSAFSTPAVETLTPEDLERVLPVVRDVHFVRAYPRASKATLLEEHYVNDLHVLYVLDFPDRVQFLVESDLEELGVSKPEIRTRAVSNFVAYAADLSVGEVESLYVLELDGTYESSVLLLDEFWSRVEEQLGAAPIAVIPTRDLLIYAASNNPEAIALMAGFAEQVVNDAGYAISPKLLKRTEGEWQAYRPR